jgi:hypothetical protein
MIEQPSACECTDIVICGNCDFGFTNGPHVGTETLQELSRPEILEKIRLIRQDESVAFRGVNRIHDLEPGKWRTRTHDRWEAQFTEAVADRIKVSDRLKPLQGELTRRREERPSVERGTFRALMSTPAVIGKPKRYVYLMVMGAYVKVGITGSPGYREAQHKAEGWTHVQTWDAETEARAREIEARALRTFPTLPEGEQAYWRDNMPQAGFTEVRETTVDEARKLIESVPT